MLTLCVKASQTLEAGAVTIPALLVSIGAGRLRRTLAGMPDAAIPAPEHRPVPDLLAESKPRSPRIRVTTRTDPPAGELRARRGMRRRETRRASRASRPSLAEVLGRAATAPARVYSHRAARTRGPARHGAPRRSTSISRGSNPRTVGLLAGDPEPSRTNLRDQPRARPRPISTFLPELPGLGRAGVPASSARRG